MMFIQLKKKIPLSIIHAIYYYININKYLIITKWNYVLIVRNDWCYLFCIFIIKTLLFAFTYYYTFKYCNIHKGT